MSSSEEAPSLVDLGLLHEEVKGLSGALAEVEGRRRAAAVAAVRAGTPKRQVALAAGVTRQTLDKWLGVWQRTS